MDFLLDQLFILNALFLHVHVLVVAALLWDFYLLWLNLDLCVGKWLPFGLLLVENALVLLLPLLLFLLGLLVLLPAQLLLLPLLLLLFALHLAPPLLDFLHSAPDLRFR